MEFEDFQKVHNQIGMVLAKLSGARDVRQVRECQDELNAKLVAGEVKSLDQLYEAILAVTK